MANRAKQQAARTARREETEDQKWLCPGPEWGPEEETCGSVLKHRGRCAKCQRERTRLRKQERAHQEQTRVQESEAQNRGYSRPLSGQMYAWSGWGAE